MLKNVLGMHNIWAPLFGFNLGIEAGQIIIISLVYPLIYLLKNEKFRNSIIKNISAGIAAAGLVLLFFRSFNH
jgi:hypothetical protein